MVKTEIVTLEASQKIFVKTRTENGAVTLKIFRVENHIVNNLGHK